MLNIIITIAGLIAIVAGIAAFASIAARQTAQYREKIRIHARSYDPDNQPMPEKPRLPWIMAAPVLAGIALVVFANAFCIVPTGYTGIRTTFGLIDQESCMPGFNMVAPFVQKISLVNNKQQDLRFDERVWGETKEQTVVYMEGILVTYQISPEASAWIYANVENWIEELVDKDLTASSLKSAARSLEADQVTDRALIQGIAKELLQQAVDGKYGDGRVVIKNIIVNNMDFDESYNAAIAKKSEAIQEQQEQAIRNQTAIDKAAAEAEAEREKARGEADAEKIRAQGKADANKAISGSITDATQRQDVIDSWNGELPRYVGSGDASLGIIENFPSAAPSEGG